MKTVSKYLKTSIFFLGLVSLLFLGCEKNVQVDPNQDWPQFKRDNYRSGNGTIALDLTTFGEDWVYNASQLPVPAWYGPAKEDTYANSGPLPSMRDYDLAYYPIVVGSKMYYGSTSDHAIHCLDTKTGEELWTFTTGGPIRIAPTFYDNKLYFGSDDGYAYCIKATNGKLVWQYAPAKNQEKKVMNNNSLISFWPIRTGILIEDDIAYFGASLLPWKDSYFCALNAKTGRPEGKGAYIRTYENMTLEGAMASTGTKIIQPQGRISPMFFNKSNGESKGQIAGTGGCFVLVTPEKNIVHAQTSRYKSITETIGEFAEKPPKDKKTKADFMSFKGGKEMVVKDDMSYILTDNSISAYSRTSKKVLWVKRNYNAHRIIESGDVLYVGGTDAVYAISTKNGLPLWQAPVKGVVYALAVADNALFASTGEGKIYCFRSGKTENTLLAENKDKAPEIDKVENKAKEEVENTLPLVVGPFVNTVSPTSVELHFTTDEVSQPLITWDDGFSKREIKASSSSKEHRVVIDKVKKDFIYTYQIKSNDLHTQYFEFDNFFNYEETLSYTSEILEKSKLFTKAEELFTSRKGNAIVFGVENATIAKELAALKGLKVLLFDTSKSKVQKLREELQETGVYGGKIEVQYVKDLNHLLITGDIANLVVINDKEINADEAIRLTKPNGYTIIDKNGVTFNDWIDNAKNSWQVSATNTKAFDVLKKAPYDATGKWTHQYGLADNTAFGGESLWGSTGTNDFEIQWMGRPGPRFQTDRSGRKPSPLAVDNKMFVQGRERIISVDAYNGNVLWSKEIPGLSRMNVLRDCSNWVADDDFLYIAHQGNVLQINHDNGNIHQIISVEKSANNKPNDWGYVSTVNNLIIGSSTPKGSGYTNYYGGDGWYDAQSGPLTDKVVSYKLFAKDIKSTNNVWTYEKPNTYIINSTITISGKDIIFVESRNKSFKLTKELRADPSIFKDVHLVSLNIETGTVNWEKPLDAAAGVTTYFLAASKNYIVLLAANGGLYHVYNYSTANGDLVWKKEQPWFSTHHGGHFSKPAIVNNRLIIKPAMYQLDSGELMENEVPKAGHGCASYALSEQSAFYRGGSVTQYNFDTNKFSQWDRLRPDCWISTIPAQGLVLSPEAGGGCSCGNWLETSMVFAPKSRAPLSFLYESEKFIDKLSIEIKAKDKNNKAIYYTLDGTEPTDASKQYTAPIVIENDTELKAVIYVDRDGEKVSYVRSKAFKKEYPEPIIVETPLLLGGNWEFTLQLAGETGDIHYTTDGATPTKASPKYTNPVVFTKKTLVKAKTFWNTDKGVVESKETSFEIAIPKLTEGINVAETKTGITRNYYRENGKSKNIPELEQLTPKKTEVVTEVNCNPYENENMFALRFKGYIYVPVDGMYTIYSKSSRSFNFVRLHKAMLQSRGNNEESEQFPLKKGYHPIIIDHYVGQGPSNYDLLIEGPNIPKQSITEAMLFH